MREDSQTKNRRRRFGLICLGLAVVLLLAGETILKSRLAGVGLLVYWMSCLVLTALAAGTAIRDALRVGQAGREEQRTLIENALREVEREKEARDRQPRPPRI